MVMSSTASSGATVVSPAERVEVLFDELAELVGQRNGIDGRIVEIVAELDRDELCGATGARSIAAVVAWKMGSSTANATTIATVAHRLAEFPRCATGHAGGPIVAGSGRGDRGISGRRDLMSIMRRWPRWPRSASCAPLSSWNRAPNPNPNPNPNPPPSRGRRSPRPPTRRSAATGSNSVTPTPRSSTRRCSRIVMR